MFRILVALCLCAPISGFAAGTASSPEIKSDMHAIADNYAKLGKQIDDKAKNMDSVKITETLIDLSKNAQKEEPARTDKTATYKSKMEGMIKTLESIKVALQTGDNGKARKEYESLKPYTNPAHAKAYK